jgi:CheY-like chemotaxis protein
LLLYSIIFVTFLDQSPCLLHPRAIHWIVEGRELGSLKAFIVEDEAITAMYLKSYLIKKGYEVLRPAATGEDAVARALDEKPDIILMDIMLGGPLDGIDAARLILASRYVAIVFITGYPNAEVLGRAGDIRHLGLISKPFSSLSLDTVIPQGTS